MPAPLQDFVQTTTSQPWLTVALEPAQSAVQSLVFLAKSDHLSGLSEWIYSTWAALSPEERRKHELVVWGFYYTFLPDRRWSSFPAYLGNLAGLNPVALRDRMLETYASMPVLNGDECPENHMLELDPAALRSAKAEMLSSFDAYLDFLGQRFHPLNVDREIESRAFDYLNDPPALQRLVVSHLREMWDRFLASEWERVQPMLQDAVRAFRQLDLEGMDRLEAARLIAGQELNENYQQGILGAERVIFIPSAHIGPYLRKISAGRTTWILFGARLPQGVAFDAPDLSRAEILVRLGALADDGRLRILRLLAERGELRSPEIMQGLEMSQPTASRHLTQLAAAGYLSERRCDGAKCYQLNAPRIEEALNAARAFLLPTPRAAATWRR